MKLDKREAILESLEFVWWFILFTVMMHSFGYGLLAAIIITPLRYLVHKMVKIGDQ